MMPVSIYLAINLTVLNLLQLFLATWTLIEFPNKGYLQPVAQTKSDTKLIV